WGRSEWRFTSNIYTVNANIQRLVENTLDPAHTEFVHPVMGFRGEKEEYRLDDLELVETAWGCSSKTRSVDTPNAVGSVKREVQGGSAKTETNTGHFGPNATYTCIHFSPKAWSHQYAFVTPIDQYTSRRFFIQGRNFALDATADDRMNTRTWDIIEQDRVVIEKILPVLTPSRASEEVIVPADQVIIRYREFLADWASRGWLIDYDAIMAAGSGKAFSIPSPARRNSKGWALETTPMVASPSIGDVAAE
ncbi:MAG: hypothetical protein KDE14_10855, partial [Rhodobacteraceae bacterium]|nr:hypothetical protein [Paracoccaceae bacterium]